MERYGKEASLLPGLGGLSLRQVEVVAEAEDVLRKAQALHASCFGQGL